MTEEDLVMCWQETKVMDERLKFISACLAGDDTMSLMCERFGISRKTGYKWLGRYKALGAVGLFDLPKAPLAHGRATPDFIVAALLAEKGAHPLWGPKKLIARLKRADGSIAWPAVSSAGEILKRHGLVGTRRKRWRGVGEGPFAPAMEVNDVWSADHKGWFRLRDNQRCEPLTIMDSKSRYILGVQAGSSTSEGQNWPVFERLFRENGLPRRIRSDNGPPFASAGITGLTPLSVRFIKLGIGLERITPGKPQQNGRHERFHATMLPLQRNPAKDQVSQQQAFDAFCYEYNHERPHEALGQTMPGEHYTKSPRPMPDTLPEPHYPEEATVRSVRHNGEIRWNSGYVYVSQTIAGEKVAVTQNDEGQWIMQFHDHTLGTIDQRTNRLIRPTKQRSQGSTQ
jgi:putative transposase